MILFRYILREYFRFATGTLVLCLFFFILFDFIQKAASYLGKYNPPPAVLVKYYLLQLPFEAYQALPIASLIASVVVMLLLNRSGEVTAMRAIGMSPWRMVLPLAAGGMILTVFSFFLTEFAIPYTAKKSHYIKQVVIEGEDAGLSEGAYWLRTPKFTIGFKAYRFQSQVLENVKVITLNPVSFAPQKTIHAKNAIYLDDYKLWYFQNANILYFSNNMVRVKSFPFLVLRLPIEPQKLRYDRRTPLELSLSEIKEVIEQNKQANGEILSYRIVWHMKFAYPMAALLISFLGLRFAYRNERASETIKGLFLVLAFAISYWFILSTSKALCSSGLLPPFFAGWLANLWLVFVLGWQLWKLRQENEI